MMALEENQIGLSFTNSLPFVAHYGSMKPCIGTNPLSITFPCGKYRPFVLDMATSVVARGNIINCAREGKDIPYGWACDETGHPTTNADAALKGYCLPLGADRNYKGSGIALSIDILCGIINGGCAGLDVRPIFTLAEDELSKGPGIGHAFAAIDIDYFMDVEEFKARMDHYIEELKKAPLAPGFEEILMPGEPEFRQYDIHTARGSVEVALENLNEIKVITQKFCPEVNPEDYIL